MKTIYSVPMPFHRSGVIEVYGDPDACWYEWRLVVSGDVLHDTGNACYGVAEVALRDALVEATREVLG